MTTFAEYVHGDETTRLTFERANPEDLYEHRRVYDAWDTETAERERAIAKALFGHGGWAHSGDLERESCSGCVLRGFLSESSRLDGMRKEDGPNYAGWARVYVQAGYPIPSQWRDAFTREGHDNEAYYNALGRDLVTFGHPGFMS